MPNWKTMTQPEANTYFAEFGQKVRNGTLDLGIEVPHYLTYALGMAHGVRQAIHCGYDRLAVIEFGVFFGVGLHHLCRAARFFRADLGLEINVYGFDTAAGLPALKAGYKDHPELFHSGAFVMPDQDGLRASLPDFCELIVGDVADTLPGFRAKLGDKRLIFASYDLDLYSSTKSALELLTWDAECYLPGVPLYFDDMVSLLTHSDWAGEQLAIREFNEENQMRKIDHKSELRFRIANFHVCQVLDHPMRQGGAAKPRFGLSLSGI